MDFWHRLRSVLNGRFVPDVKPKPGGGVRRTHVEKIEKKGSKKKG